MRDQPPLTLVPKIPPPGNDPFPGRIRLRVDATDVDRGIFQVREIIPVSRSGSLTLFYPKWLPGFHSPAAAIQLFAGVEIYADDLRLAWRRDPVEVHAFHLDVPHGCNALDIRFQFLSPTAKSQGTVAVTPAITAARWSAMVLYPAGCAAECIEVEPEIRLPDGWRPACALEPGAPADGVSTFAAIPLDELVDSPVLAGRWTRRIVLDEAGDITLDLAGDHDDLISPSEAQIQPHRNLIAEADALFGSRPFRRYRFLTALSGHLGGGGVEHHQCSEILAPPAYFTAWDANAPKRDVFAHEYVHAWNGKGRRGEDSHTASFEQPIRNSLMWVYEGLTQYWGEVLAARSGLWTPQNALDTLARTAALYDNRPGSRWRPMSDTTRDPIIAGRQPLPWPSWQRSEDYYAEGQLLWLDVDTLIRELSGDTRSLDDFAHAFFTGVDGKATTSTYVFKDVVAGLAEIAGHDWTGFLTERLEQRAVGAPLDGLTRGGYRLVYADAASDFATRTDSLAGLINLNFSIGLTVTTDGVVQEVIWNSPAFQAGAVPGARVRAVNRRVFDPQGLHQAIVDAETSGELEVTLERAGTLRSLHIAYADGRRFPRLEAVEGARRRLDDILKPRT